jgi:putative Holliday junction resolvase
MARILGVDYGLRRIGLAVSDPTATLAQPLPFLLRRRGKRPPVGTVVELVKEHGAEAVVVGLPLDSQGEEDAWTAEVRTFGDRVGERSGVPVHYIDERFTSAAAERAVRSLGLSKTERERKERVDTAAAVLILQSWLDRR